jgi:hypothetical protein
VLVTRQPQANDASSDTHSLPHTRAQFSSINTKNCVENGQKGTPQQSPHPAIAQCSPGPSRREKRGQKQRVSIRKRRDQQSVPSGPIPTRANSLVHHGPAEDIPHTRHIPQNRAIALMVPIPRQTGRPINNITAKGRVCRQRADKKKQLNGSSQVRTRVTQQRRPEDSRHSNQIKRDEMRCKHWQKMSSTRTQG